MPQILDRLVNQLTSKGLPKDKAYATAVKVLTKSGNLDKNQNITAKGRKRQSLGASGRAKDRAAKKAGRSSSDYNYNSATNRATLKDSSKPSRLKKKVVSSYKKSKNR